MKGITNSLLPRSIVSLGRRIKFKAGILILASYIDPFL